MANKNISELPAITTADKADLFHIWDTDAGVAKKATPAQVLKTQHLTTRYAGEFASINQAITDIGAVNLTRLVISSSQTQTINVALTVTANITLVFDPGGEIVKNGTSTLAIESYIFAGPWKIFSGFDPGDVTINGSTPRVLAEWWGALGDDLNDDSIPFNSADQADNAVLFLYPKTYLCNFSLSGKTNLEGCGPLSVLKAMVPANAIVTVTERLGGGATDLVRTGRTLKDFGVDGVDLSGIGIKFDALEVAMKMENVVAWRCHRAVSGEAGFQRNVWDRVSTYNCNYGIYLKASGTVADVLHQNMIKDCIITQSHLCAVYMDGTADGGGNELLNTRIENNASAGGYGVIMKGMSKLTWANKFIGGWIERPADVAGQITMDDEGLVTPVPMLFNGGIYHIVSEFLHPGSSFTDCSVIVSGIYRGMSATKGNGFDTSGSSVNIEEAIISAQNSAIIQGSYGSNVKVERIRTQQAESRGGAAEGCHTRQAVTGQTNQAATSDTLSEPDTTAISGATITDLHDTRGGNGVIRVECSDDTERADISVTVSDAKIYAYGFEIKGTSANHLVPFSITGSGNLVTVQNINVRLARWTTIVGVVEGRAALTSMTLRFGAATGLTSDFKLGRAYFVEFDSYEDAYAFNDGREFPQNAGVSLSASETWNPGSIADAGFEANDITLVGAELGDIVLCSFSLDVQDLTLTADVTTAGVVTAILSNQTGGAVDLAEGTVKVQIIR